METSSWRSPYREDQSETKPILLPVAVVQTLIGATSTSIITVAMVRFKIKGRNMEVLSHRATVFPAGPLSK